MQSCQVLYNIASGESVNSFYEILRVAVVSKNYKSRCSNQI